MPATARQSIQDQGYFRKLWNAASTTFEGMAVTLANFVRTPITVEYPDRLKDGQKLWEVLPERTRGFLEVDTEICTACTLCETACPIDCIQILIEKREDPEKGKKIRGMSAFDIDLGKCMYCGLCVEPCPTGAIRMSTQFEGAHGNLESMFFRFVPLGGFVVPFKAPKKTRLFPTRPPGEIAREVLRRMREENEGLFAYIRKRKAELSAGPAADEAAALSPLETKKLRFKAKLRPGETGTLVAVLRSVMADTDCGACSLADGPEWDCDGYAKGLAERETTDLDRCEPGGDETRGDIALIYELWNELNAEAQVSTA